MDSKTSPTLTSERLILGSIGHLHASMSESLHQHMLKRVLCWIVF